MTPTAQLRPQVPLCSPPMGLCPQRVGAPQAPPFPRETQESIRKGTTFPHLSSSGCRAWEEEATPHHTGFPGVSGRPRTPAKQESRAGGKSRDGGQWPNEGRGPSSEDRWLLSSSAPLQGGAHFLVGQLWTCESQISGRPLHGRPRPSPLTPAGQGPVGHSSGTSSIDTGCHGPFPPGSPLSRVPPRMALDTQASCPLGLLSAAPSAGLGAEGLGCGGQVTWGSGAPPGERRQLSPCGGASHPGGVPDPVGLHHLPVACRSAPLPRPHCAFWE